MSDPTYRIDVIHDPHAGGGTWDAKITRLSDDMPLVVVWGDSREAAARKAQEWIAEERDRATGSISLLVDDDGRPVEGHSVEVS